MVRTIGSTTNAKNPALSFLLTASLNRNRPMKTKNHTPIAAINVVLNVNIKNPPYL